MRRVRSPNKDTLKVGPRSLSKGISYRSSLSATRTHSLPFTMLRVASYNSSTLKKSKKNKQKTHCHGVPLSPGFFEGDENIAGILRPCPFTKPGR